MGYNLTQINPAYELVKDVVVGTATTSVDFTGLNITKDDDYMLVSSVMNPAGSTSYLSLFANNNTTQTNYYSQYVYADGTTTLSGRDNLNSICYNNSSGYSFSKTQIKLTNNGYFIAQSEETRKFGGSSIALQKIHTTSTFTSTSITSLKISSDIASGISSGSRFQLYKRVAPIVYDYTVAGSAITQLDITGLEIDENSEYMLVSDIVANGNSAYFLYANSDTTSTNYYYQYLSADSTTISASRSTGSNIAYLVSGRQGLIYSQIKLTNNGFYTHQSNVNLSYGTSSISLAKYYISKTSTLTSITQLSIVASTASAIGVGSRFQLIKLK